MRRCVAGSVGRPSTTFRKTSVFSFSKVQSKTLNQRQRDKASHPTRPESSNARFRQPQISENTHYTVKRIRYRAGVAQRVGRGIALLFHNGGTRRGRVVSSGPRPYFTPGKEPVPILTHYTAYKIVTQQTGNCMESAKTGAQFLLHSTAALLVGQTDNRLLGATDLYFWKTQLKLFKV